MLPERITVLGGGNTAISVAANLALGGSQVLLWEHPSLAAGIAPLEAGKTVHLEGTERTGAARLAGVTTDIKTALAWSSTILMSAPAYAHRLFAECCAPHVQSGQTITLLPGTLGALEFARVLRDRGVGGVTVAEVDTSPYVCRKTAPDRAVIWGRPGAIGLGVFPARRTEALLPVIQACFPGTRAYPNVLACGLSSLNPLMHPAGVLMNAGRIERSRGEFYFYEEGVTPAVVTVIEAVDAERLALGRALGQSLQPVAAAFHAAGFGPAGDLWSVINGSQMLTALRAPGMLRSRWLTEDLPYGLVTWSSLAAQLGLATPHMDALIVLISTILQTDCRAAGRSAADLGLADLSPDQITRLLTEGWE